MHRLIKTAVFVLVLIAALFLCEYILRNVVGIVPGTERMVTYQFDDTLGWKSRADYKYYRSSLYYGHFNYYDPQGFPTDVMRWHEAASSSASSVAILGSSHAESYYLPYEQSFPYLIEKKTGKQVLNLGVSGYAPDQYLLRARAELPKYDVSDIVIIFFPYNDLPGIESDEYQGFMKPRFGDSLLAPENLPLVPPAPPKEETGIVARVRNSAVYTLLRPVVRKAIAVNLRTSAKQPQPFETEEMSKVFDFFGEIQKENSSKRVIIYEIPFYREIGDDTLYRANLVLYETECAKHALICASMDPIIATHSRRGEIFIEGDGHVTAYGAKLIADQLAEILASPR
ncbi:MAG: hypothetical protein A3C93_04880 [Candidatus Lloydbacteria bacterium RIFCSPHIGHO2_02_FULL_54_17]|uniref:SGNH hydrolase-type esterase domain-containing protein n=1 Tax=Candidatus Lloydbacteria bacterium RIFCSPHIGHO2_02_FULL_54_17 TaxID=1798664 RepID=A0A1G2DGC5_9BACT|nr:MAG: hypothetical protein A2762_01795 [Candidatus Lloydbacteria bacterium RIFCSPHIGHO2_01_FULL_54_11]OGZ12482.1 MAG: hypothetical protein A3C93_04880 [Candidatus Lloydbacteria bacterium RIFCSPHIGHO2_02_FULL_54_17]OGZ14740.1 MAG: hypothetical protein A2948_04560 [Candidatus Lloydbacteria bacterium RIFCSPLOWO2_01_FULL_54_18]OGZ15601.1 MAG: hypothetical protein A3H76_04015 [Candidatus Lloydbacteria bacterium RIFCSPLOWO2_02_FULL_54_12]